MVSDKMKDIQCIAEETLGQFLSDIQTTPEKVDFGSLVKILIPRCTSQDDLTRLIAITWLHSFVKFGKDTLIPYVHSMLGAVIPSISCAESEEIRKLASDTNELLSELIMNTEADVSISNLIQQIGLQLRSDYVDSRLAALRWVSLLYEKYPQNIDDHLDKLFSIILKMLSDSSEVVTLCLEVMSKIAHNDEYFKKLISSLVSIFNSDPSLLEEKGTTMFRQLSLHIPPERVYSEIALVLASPEYDPDFCSLMVQMLNLILLTSIEFSDMRNNLKDLLNSEHKNLFVRLYKTWCYNPASTFSLCLIAEAYGHAYNLVCQFSELEINVSFLVEIDKLVQLIESPIFTGKIIMKKTKNLYFICIYINIIIFF